MITHVPKETTIKTWVELIIFISSYYPLFLILYIRDIGVETVGINFGILEWGLKVSFLATTFLVVSSFCTLLTGYIMRRLLKKSEGGTEVRICKSDHIRGDMINYTLPFLIGLFAFDYSSWQSIISLIVFLIFMFSFTKKEKIILLNPMFLLMNIRLYNVEYIPVGQNITLQNQVLCLGLVEASDVKVEFKENSGINFIYPVAGKA